MCFRFNHRNLRMRAPEMAEIFSCGCFGGRSCHDALPIDGPSDEHSEYYLSSTSQAASEWVPRALMPGTCSQPCAGAHCLHCFPPTRRPRDAGLLHASRRSALAAPASFSPRCLALEPASAWRWTAVMNGYLALDVSLAISARLCIRVSQASSFSAPKRR